MNILFISISSLPHMSEHSISLDLIHEFIKNGHKVYVVSAIERSENRDTYVSTENGCDVLRVKIGNNKKANLIEKGITTLLLPYMYISAIKKYFSNVKFDLVLYPTPPVTQVKTVKFIKNRDGAKSYLLLKDIFPQNSVDIGLLSKVGILAPLYWHFRLKEKQLYRVSDKIGCMSQANVEYLLQHNLDVPKHKVEICPNAIEFIDQSAKDDEVLKIREKYNVPTDKIVFVYGGNLGKPQGIPFIVDCLKACKNNEKAYFIIVGDGTEYDKLANYVEKENPKNVKLLKRLPKNEFDLLLLSCDVGLVFLDYRFTIPNFPSRILSYMQAGLPILACTDKSTDVGKVISENGFGWKCDSGDITSFESALYEIIETADSIAAMGNIGKKYMKNHYNVENNYRIIMSSLEEC